MLRSILSLFFMFLIVFTTADAQDFDFFEPTTTLGGYGELHYNYSQPENGKVTKILDFHRFVLFFSHSFTEKWSFKSEVELEHNFVRGGQGELELEQAYLDYRHSNYFGFNIGVVLPSIGLINEYHEPPLFFGVERPVYNNVIIPTTWFGNGAAVYGNISGFDYKFTVMEGLNSDKFSLSSGIRGGREKGYLAKADHLLYNFRLDYLDIPGLKIGGSFTSNKAAGDSTTIQIGLYEFHGKYESGNFSASAEYGNINFGSGDVEAARGYYVDLGYNISQFLGIPTQIIPFFRYTDVNPVAETRLAGESVASVEIVQRYHAKYWMAGFNVKPLPQIVFKIDYGISTNQLSDTKTTLLNLGAGYMF
jgi:hypothetical protein